MLNYVPYCSLLYGVFSQNDDDDGHNNDNESLKLMGIWFDGNKKNRHFHVLECEHG